LSIYFIQMEVNSLAPYYTDLIKSAIDSGKYRTESDVIEAGLELLRKEELQQSLLESAIKHGEDSGLALPFDNEDFKKRMHLKIK
jgi:putative addiction module CopG family antidote